MESRAPFAAKSTLSNVDITKFMKNHNINGNILTLEEFHNDPDSANAYCVLFTGETKNEINNGYTHHWLGMCGDYIFDSYGYYSDYKFPITLNEVKCFPKRLQEFNSNVCGEYVLAFITFCQNKKLQPNIGRDFCYHHEFSTNRNQNDKTVLEWYEKNK